MILRLTQTEWSRWLPVWDPADLSIYDKKLHVLPLDPMVGSCGSYHVLTEFTRWSRWIPPWDPVDPTALNSPPRLFLHFMSHPVRFL